MGFQKTVNIQPGVGQAGDFAAANLRTTVIAGPGGFIAAPSPRAPIVGNFAWGNQNPAFVDLGNLDVHGNPAVGTLLGQYALGTYYGEAGAEIGFVHREAQIPIYPYLADNTYAYVQGQIISLYNEGDFWATFAAGATVGQKVFANYKDGSVYGAATGTSTQTASVTAALANTGVLTVTVVGSGTIHVGDVNKANGFAVLSQLSGTAGGVGTYQTSLTGTTIGSGALTFDGSVETAYYVDSPAAAGELAKITTWG